MNITHFVRDLLHVLLPNLCLACDTALFAHESIVCTECLYHLPLTDFHHDVNNETARQLWGKLDFEVAMSMLYLSKNSRVERLIHQLKYGNRPQIGRFLGKMYGRIINDIAKDQGFDMLVAIPIHNRKRRERGYNQAFQFGIGLSESLGIPVHENVLKRKVYNISQTKKSRSERYENVEGVFSVNPRYSMLQDKHVALVDDILTTGATLSEAGRILKLSGAKVSVLTIARA